ncbi:MAG: hypothetical protein P4L53_01785 [Candidatus Obscuribacterales bacterium]|nr:hypothetical protein [Candidatus Obscuribacterales bacterium]
MANNEFDATPRVEQNALTSGDHNVSKINFSEVMEGHKDPLTEALFKNEAAIKLASAKIEDIYKRAAQVHPDGLAGFLKNHEASYA